MSGNKEFSKWLARTRVDVKSNLDIRKYLSSGSEMLRQANVYRGEKDIVRAYFMYTKYTSLFLEDLRKHPEYVNVPKAEKTSINRNVKQALAEAEKLKEAAEQTFNQIALERAKVEPTLPTYVFEMLFLIFLLVIFLKMTLGCRKLDETPGNGAEFESPTFYSSGLRKILVPMSLIPKFLELAKTNTEKNIETCGLLAGTLQQNRLTITVLIIPEQTGSSDHCVAENEIDFFNVIDQRGLLSFGWIHVSKKLSRKILSTVGFFYFRQN